jgi:adenylosuccinate synthase
MKYSCLINGYDSLNITKLDILDDLPEIKVGVKYIVDGKELEGFPGTFVLLPELARHTRQSKKIIIISFIYAADLELLARVDVSYVTLPGWKKSIVGCTSFEALPENCKKYILYIESVLGVPIEWIGVGPGREEMIKRG